MRGNKIKRLGRIRLYPLLLLAVMGVHPVAHALTIESHQQLEYADSLFSNQQYLRAAEEYQRFTFFFPDHPQIRSIHYKSGKSFLLSKDPETAIAIFNALASLKPPDKYAIEAFFKLSECHLELNSPTQAMVQLNNVIAHSASPANKDRAYYKIGWIYIDSADWDSAKAAFAQMSSTGQQQYRIQALILSISEASTIPKKNPTVAGTLSVVPGAGQFYCNRYEDAIIAFAVNTGLIWAAYDAFDNEQYGLGGLLSFVGIGFYVGNIYGAVNDAHKYNHRRTRQFVDQLKQQQIQLTRLPYDNATRQGPMLSFKIPF